MSRSPAQRGSIQPELGYRGVDGLLVSAHRSATPIGLPSATRTRRRAVHRISPPPRSPYPDLPRSARHRAGRGAGLRRSRNDPRTSRPLDRFLHCIGTQAIPEGTDERPAE
jgi:hypothetical protein